MKKILFFIPTLGGGGAEKVLVNMVNHLDASKYQVEILTLFDLDNNKKALSPNVKYTYCIKKFIRGYSKVIKLFPARFLYRILVKGDYDMVVSYCQGPTTRIAAGCTNPDVKLVQWIHNEFHEQKKITKAYKSVSECIELQKKYDATVYVAQTVKDAYLKTFPEIKKNDVVLYNIVESEEIKQKANEAIEEKNLYDADINLVCVGSFSAQKALHRLINIIKRLEDENINAKLILLGDGGLRKDLQQQCHTLKVEDKVVFLGYKANPYKYVKNADLFVCSSLHEGFSTAVTESLIVGTPVITTNCSGMSELLGDNEYGIIVDNDEEALYNGVLSLIKDKEKLNHYKKQAIKRGEKFDMRSSVEKIEEFLDKMLEV